MSIIKSPINPKAKRAVAIGVCLAALFTVLLLALNCCSVGQEDEAVYIGSAIEQSNSVLVRTHENLLDPEMEPAGTADSNEQAQSAPNVNDTEVEAAVTGSPNTISRQDQDNPPVESEAAQPSINAAKTWIVDKPAWTESIPVYTTTEVSICNVCGADITGNTSAHGKQHMLAGEGSGHHSEVRQVQTGTETIIHPEEGHWE